jgi:crossover junction endodeoxyribonuclease RuvC
MFAFGESFGVIRGVVSALGMPLELVTPATWKRRFGLIGAEKDAARTKATELYPGIILARKKDVGRADALLIARYGLELEQQRRAA